MAWTDVNVLAQAYAKQRVYRRHSDWLGQAIFQTSLERSMGSIFERSRLLPILGQFAAQERQLLARYRQVLRRFGRSIPTDTATTR
jgi:hypothetical protein